MNHYSTKEKVQKNIELPNFLETFLIKIIEKGIKAVF